MSRALKLTSIEIFVGEPVEYASERATLQRTFDFLSERGIPAALLANFNLDGRQIDLVVGLGHGTLIVESKGFRAAVEGGENGPWKMRLGAGGQKQIPNAYGQTLSQKWILRDAMAAFVGAAVPPPTAALLFVPDIPPGSAIPKSDIKVAIVGLNALPGLIGALGSAGWSPDQWRRFASHHILTKVPSIDAALSPELFAADRLLETYGDAFGRTYGPLASEMVAVACASDDGPTSSDTVQESGVGHESIMLMGPSGCGKSLLSFRIALAMQGRGHVPIVIPAKDFEGRLGDVTNREAALLDAPSMAAVIAAARRLHCRLLLVVDGYNECMPSERPRLTRSVIAAMKRYDANVVVSSRLPLERDDLLPLRRYTLQLPDTAVKLAIAQRAAGDASLDRLTDLLGSVGSGLEAQMIGQLGQLLPSGASRFDLFDAYVRERLGQAASDGIRALSRVAGVMTERISFGLSVRDLDRLADQEGISSELLQRLQTANILVRRADRVSFSHEMFLNVFAAEAIIRRAGNDPNAVVEALRLPRHLETRPFVLGAIDDDSFRRRVLSEMTAARVIQACLFGECGDDARRWANARCDEVLAAVAREIETVRFDVSEDFHWGVQAIPETLQDWGPQDRASLAAIPFELMAGRRLDQILDLIGRLDEQLAIEHRRLRDEARDKKVNLRTGLYSISYTWGGQHAPALCRICSPVGTGRLYDGPKVAPAANLYDRLRPENLSPGQIGLLIELDRYSARDAPPIGRLLPGILDRAWATAPHHLRLGLVHAAFVNARELVDDDRRALIAALEALPMGAGNFDAWGVIDALKSLGALDEDQNEYLETVRAEIAAVLADRDNPDMWDRASGLWSAQFDHPYDRAYWEAWNSLPADDRKVLLAMAARCAQGDSLFTPSLIAELASHADQAAGPIIARWTALPAKRHVIMSEAIRSFEIAYAALARLHCPLPDHSAQADGPADEALLACGQVLYWLNRDDLAEGERKERCAPPLAILVRHETGVAAAAVGEFLPSGRVFDEAARSLPGSDPAVTSLGGAFPDEIAAIYRAALAQPNLQSGYFEFFRPEDVIRQALSALGAFGNMSDIPQLRAWSDHPEFGFAAITAIRALETSAASRPR